MADASQPSSWVLNTRAESFQQDVFEKSRQVPVLVDFWAEWCQPCRTLGPVLESLANEFQGAFVLVKANTEENFEAAQQFGVQGIPAVYAVSQGEVMDGFTGVLPEPQLRQFIDSVLARHELQAARSYEEESPEKAEQVYRQALESDPNNSEASAGIARVLLLQKRFEQCAQWIEKLEQRGFLEPDAERVKAALELRDADDDVESCRQAAQQQPDDLQRQLKLAEALAKQQQYEEALERLLGVVQQDHGTLREEARQRMVDVFRVLPDDSPLTRDYRKKLSMALY